ncbi:hypothetical protein GCK32_014356 [Trichostrongylus colubriformis]|uniref:MGAT4 conserved region domain-containing protein n=1 Tax=Trichostrongylus colubriformis TaxID=6319 RepID=A0AAN8F8U5_TRICO
MKWDDLLLFFPDLRDIPLEDLDPVYLTSPVHERRKLIVGIPVAERKTDYLIATLTSLFQNLKDIYRWTRQSSILERLSEKMKTFSRVIFNYLSFEARNPWFVMEFSWMGFIGKLFRCSDLKYMTHAIALYYQFKPVDWILMDALKSRYCSLDDTDKNCVKAVRCHQISSGTSQFQHNGKISSLAGKIQGIHDSTFGKGRSEASLYIVTLLKAVAVTWPSREPGKKTILNFYSKSNDHQCLRVLDNGRRWNPPAIITTSMPTYQKHNAQVGYTGNVAIWFTNVTEGGYLSIMFNKTNIVTGVMFLSGVPPAVLDKFGPETEVYAIDKSGEKRSLGKFSPTGDFLYQSDGIAAKELRLEITASLDRWVTLDHIRIHTNSQCNPLLMD